MNRRSSFYTGVACASILAIGLAACVDDDPDAAPPTARSTDPTSVTVSTPGVDGNDGPRTGAFGRSRLTFFADCPELLSYLQTESLERVTAWGLGGNPYYYGRGGEVFAPDVTMAAAATEDQFSEGSVDATAPAYSTTNTQEVGVDEGDIVETNGTEVFVAGPDGVRVIDVARAAVIDELDVADGTHQLLLDGDRLLIVTQPFTGIEDTIISLFDVADPSNAVLLRRAHLEGRVVATRSIDGVARLMLSSTLATRLPFVYPDQFGLDEQRALAENQRIIRESSVEQWMPRWFAEGEDGSFGEMSTSLDCSNVAAPRDFAGLGISWIASIDVRAASDPVGSAGIVSNSETVYASTDNVYLATQVWDWYYPADGVQPDTTAPPTLVHQFALGADGSAAWVASGEVPGRLLNQFAMSEHEGDLRVASTIDDWTGAQQSESVVTVLRPQDGELAEIGSVRGLGVTEQIYAVRFLGTQAYVVTFRQTDPLYVVDLSDPTNPVVTGELKIPGYSAYLHPVGDGLLLGVGQDADLDGRTLGTQMSLFDVSDPANPVQLSTLQIGGSSEAEWDHKAFLFWPEDGTIVIPTSPWWGPCADCLAGQVQSPGGGVIVAQLQGTELINRGVIEHEARTDTGCWNPLQRSMIIGSEIVTVGLDQVKFTDRATLVGRDQTRWGSPDEYGCYYWVE
jgi:Beta propeller domain